VKRCLFLIVGSCCAQDFTQRGFFESANLAYPQTAPLDSGRFVSEALFRYDAQFRVNRTLTFFAGVEARTDSHRQTERAFHLSWLDRTLERPAFAVSRLSATYTAGRLSVEAGKQIIRWGKADILNPTDRFAPRDFVNVADADLLPVAAVRLTYGGQSSSLEFVWQPLFTPSRTPLVNQRWVALPRGLAFVDRGARYPGGSTVGLRFNHIGRVAEYSVSFFDGHNHLPTIDAGQAVPVSFQRFYPAIRMYGGDAAVPLRLFTVKAEAAYVSSQTDRADDYALYVLQVERQIGELSLTGGYAGEAATNRRALLDFSPERGLARAFLARAAYTIGPDRSVSAETAIRRNGNGVWVKFGYSHAIGVHWRATAGMVWIAGDDADFIGQYHRNSHAFLRLRYSF
jgi:hypothetical protein